MGIGMKKQLLATTVCAMAALSVAGFAQDLTKKIDFTADAAPASRVFEQLSQKAGFPLRAAGPVANDVLLLNLSDVTVADAMNRIAATLRAEWKKDDSGYVLNRGSHIESADRRSETAARVALFRANLKPILDEHKKQGAFDISAANKLAELQRKMNEDMERQMASGGGAGFRTSGDFQSAASQTPSSRAIAALLARMSDTQIASLTSGTRTVFSLKPTRMQLAMPNGALPILQQFVKENQTYRNATQANEPAGGGNFQRRVVVNGFGADGGGDGDPSLGIGYAILVNQPGLGGPNTSVSLVVADPNGRTLASGQMVVAPRPGAPVSEQKGAAQNEKPIEVSALSKELASALEKVSPGGGAVARSFRVLSIAAAGSPSTFTLSGDGGTGTPKLSDALKQRILNPEKYDPMSFAPGEAFSLAAEARNLDLVAYLPDTAFSSLNRIAGTGSPTPTSLFVLAKSQAGLEVKEESGWLLVAPQSPASARDRRVHREALGNALRQMDAKGYLGLDQWANFASRQAKAPRMSEIDDAYLRLINGPAADSGLNQFMMSGGWQMLQFYSSMSNGQRQTMAANGSLPLGTLSARQRNLVHEQGFNSIEGPMITEEQEGRRIVTFGPMQSLLSERTYLLPTGIPANGILNFRSRTDEVVQAVSSQNGGGRFLNVDSLAFERVRLERPELANLGNAVQYDQYRIATQRSFDFQFQFSPRVSLNRQLVDETPGSQGFAAYDRLPARFRQRVDAAAEQLKKIFGQGGGRGGLPPPARD